jgi:asparagine synthase (glutamine-hydrolysing)
MCSFLVTNKKISDIDNINFYLKFRGPDHTAIKKINEWTFIHNLLSITGDFTPQPLEKNGVFVIFNGEIYNYNDGEKKYTSDGFFIIDQYLDKGADFVKFLDGEFALVILDTNINKLYFSGDCFLTKPIFVGTTKEQEIGISSYKSALERLNFINIYRVTPNFIFDLDLTEWKLNHSYIKEWDLQQNVDSYEQWEQAFFNSVNKRINYHKTPILVPMSSGYDSGSIVCALQHRKYDNYLTYSFVGNEDKNIVNQRFEKNYGFAKDNSIVKQYINDSDRKQIMDRFLQSVEPFYYGYFPTEEDMDGFEDKGAIGLYYLLQEVKTKYNIKVQLSGQGGDEIMSNLQTYGFGGKFNPKFWPKDQSQIFPWANFYYGSNWSYLNKEECIAGSLGIETRYPLLDKQVVQSYLNLIPELKNKYYKAPLRYLFDKYQFPYKEEKLGFNLQIL